ncbi:MAG: IS5 family transposase [Chitinispirillales bacterium]|jgi:IS5 family transposase|nr:IS5 family transposase [Chitinispirillales bacterium]
MIGNNVDKTQHKLFSTLDELLNPKHPLFALGNRIDWSEFDSCFKDYYSTKGRPAKPIRLMVSLLLLKQMYDLSDEGVVEQWVQNPYFQYFSGENVFQWVFPCAPSDLVHFRKRIGESGVQKILKVSIDIHGNAAHEQTVIADTTVQEKNITFPTDIKLHSKIINKCNEMAEKEHIILRQSYKRTTKALLLAQRFKTHPKTGQKALRAQKKLRTIAGRLCRELRRKLSQDSLLRYKNALELYEEVLKQKKTDNNKIYSLHEPDVYCISKGKDHKKYEFGSKVSILVTKDSGIIVGALSLDTNLYDGHTLPQALQQYETLMNKRPGEVIADRGYKGRKFIEQTIISTPTNGCKSLSANEKRKIRDKFRRRASIEPVIGHLKSDTKLKRNYLKGLQGDKINAMLAAAAFNFRKWMRKFFAPLKNLFQYLKRSVYIRVYFKYGCLNNTF